VKNPTCGSPVAVLSTLPFTEQTICHKRLTGSNPSHSLHNTAWPCMQLHDPCLFRVFGPRLFLAPTTVRGCPHQSGPPRTASLAVTSQARAFLFSQQQDGPTLGLTLCSGLQPCSLLSQLPQSHQRVRGWRCIDQGTVFMAPHAPLCPLKSVEWLQVGASFGGGIFAMRGIARLVSCCFSLPKEELTPRNRPPN
jgi:hypothetical protein